MNPWPFVIASFGLAFGGMALLLVQSWLAMRAAERRADEIGQRR